MKIFRVKTSAGAISYAVYSNGAYYRCTGNPGDGFESTSEILTVTGILPPVPTGSTLYAIGLNYREHAMEMDKPIPEWPVVTMKSPASIIGNEDPIRLPRHLPSDSVDFEAELAVIIARDCKNVARSQALSFVGGYCVANDVSARDWQKIHSGGQWCKGKGFDTFCPLGPALVTPDEIPNPNNLKIASRLNGETFQSSNTSDLIFGVEELIVFLSGSTTLLAGTVILTGTPPGVGTARTPPRFLQAGDQVEIEIEGLGILRNPILEEVL